MPVTDHPSRLERLDRIRESIAPHLRHCEADRIRDALEGEELLLYAALDNGRSRLGDDAKRRLAKLRAALILERVGVRSRGEIVAEARLEEI